MKKTRWLSLGSLLLVLLLVGVVAAQHWRRRARSIDEYRARSGVPQWEVDQQFQHDMFTFVRIEYDSWSDRWGRGKCYTDFPDSDWNFSYRLQQLTSLEVDPEGKVLRLTDDELFDYPWIYVIEPGEMVLRQDEVAALRKYLLGGGFMMVDDFWGQREWRNFAEQLKRVFPKREPVELPPDHEIFHCVYDLKEKPQVPAISYGMRGRSYERPDAKTPHYRALFDDDGRMMAIICHNTDLGDGWEREGVDEYYFKEYSEKKAYPMGINIVVYAMTH